MPPALDGLRGCDVRAHANESSNRRHPDGSILLTANPNDTTSCGRSSRPPTTRARRTVVRLASQLSHVRRSQLVGLPRAHSRLVTRDSAFGSSKCFDGLASARAQPRRARPLTEPRSAASPTCPAKRSRGPTEPDSVACEPPAYALPGSARSRPVAIAAPQTLFELTLLPITQTETVT